MPPHGFFPPPVAAGQAHPYMWGAQVLPIGNFIRSISFTLFSFKKNWQSRNLCCLESLSLLLGTEPTSVGYLVKGRGLVSASA
jgi:hypothetical protein